MKCEKSKLIILGLDLLKVFPSMMIQSTKKRILCQLYYSGISIQLKGSFGENQELENWNLKYVQCVFICYIF